MRTVSAWLLPARVADGIVFGLGLRMIETVVFGVFDEVPQVQRVFTAVGVRVHVEHGG